MNPCQRTFELHQPKTMRTLSGHTARSEMRGAEIDWRHFQTDRQLPRTNQAHRIGPPAAFYWFIGALIMICLSPIIYYGAKLL